MPQPTVIQGPAFVLQNGYAFYVQGDVRIRYEYETWNPSVATGGKLGERLKSKRAIVSFTPAGMYTAGTALKYWPFTQASIGVSIFTGALVSCAVIPMTGNKVTFARSGVSKLSSMKLSALATLWGPMEITCLGDPAVAPTSAAYFQAIAAATTDSTFNETQVLSPRYTATFGVVFAGEEPDEAGFEIEPVLDLVEMPTANYGVIDIIVESVGLRAKFKPLGRTEAQIATLIKLQDATALQPGDPIGTADDLIIAGTGLSFTAKKMGAMSAELVYGTGQFRQGEVAFVNKRSWTAGAPDPLWTFA